MEQNESEYFKNDFKAVFHGDLPSQSSIYTSCIVPPSSGRPSRILLSPLVQSFRVYSCSQAPKVDVFEKMYAYLHHGCQIISIHIFSASETPLEFITGITWSNNLDEDSQAYFFNIYESSADYDLINCIDSLELDFVPYQLTHTPYNSEGHTCFILSGSDNRIHVFCYGLEQAYAEVEVDELFPEFVKDLPSVALSVDFKCQDGKRYTGIGLECGTFITFIVDLETMEIIDKYQYSFEGPLTNVIFFPTGNLQCKKDRETAEYEN